MKVKDIDKLFVKIEHWQDYELEDIGNLLAQIKTASKNSKFWTKEEQTNGMMELRWKISDLRFELDQLLKATFK